MEKKSSILKAVMSRIWSLLIFFIFLMITSYISSKFNFKFFDDLYELLFSSVLIIIGLNVYFILGGVFIRIKFPFSMASPMFYAPGAILLTKFVLKIMRFMDDYIAGDVFAFLNGIEKQVYLIVYLAVIIIGYIIVISEIEKGDKKDSVSMEEVKEEFKSSFRNLIGLVKNPPSEKVTKKEKQKDKKSE